MKNIITSGCSYSDISNTLDNTVQARSDVVYSHLLGSKYNHNSINLANCGQSNDKIIKVVYDNIQEDTTYICQLTFLHRRGRYVDIADEWLDFQPAFFHKPKLKNKKILWEIVKDTVFFDATKKDEEVSETMKTLTNETKLKLENWYNEYLSKIHNNVEEFKHLMYQIDMLQSYVEKFNSNILFMYWPEIESDFELKNLKDRNFININDNYSMLNWSTSNNLLGWDSHVNHEGHSILADKLNSLL